MERAVEDDESPWQLRPQEREGGRQTALLTGNTQLRETVHVLLDYAPAASEERDSRSF